MSSVIQLAAVSYNLAGAVAATGISDRTIRQAIKDGVLVAHYVGSKPFLRALDLDDWIESLPTEPTKARAS